MSLGVQICGSRGELAERCLNHFCVLNEVCVDIKLATGNVKIAIMRNTNVAHGLRSRCH